MAWPRLLAEAIFYEFPQKHAECRLGEALNKPIGLREFVMPYVVQGMVSAKERFLHPAEILAIGLVQGQCARWCCR